MIWRRPQVKLWAREILERDDWVVLDLETTGLGRDAWPVEIAVVGPSSRVRLATLVQPPIQISSRACRVHGIRQEDLVDSPDLSAVYSLLESAVPSQTLVLAYNAAFDQRILKQASKAVGHPLPTWCWNCLLDRYEMWRGFRPPLATACEIEGLPAPTHRAIPDAKAAWALLSCMAED